MVRAARRTVGLEMRFGFGLGSALLCTWVSAEIPEESTIRLHDALHSGEDGAGAGENGEEGHGWWVGEKSRVGVSGLPVLMRLIMLLPSWALLTLLVSNTCRDAKTPSPSHAFPHFPGMAFGIGFGDGIVFAVLYAHHGIQTLLLDDNAVDGRNEVQQASTPQLGNGYFYSVETYWLGPSYGLGALGVGEMREGGRCEDYSDIVGIMHNGNCIRYLRWTFRIHPKVRSGPRPDRNALVCQTPNRL